MPLYEYQCPKCGVFELIRKFSDEPVIACPTCGSEIRKLASAPAFHLKGTGWYATDYAKKSAGDSKPGEGKSGQDKSADAKPAEGKAGEGKPAEGKASESKSSEGQSETKAAKDSPGKAAASTPKKSDRS